MSDDRKEEKPRLKRVSNVHAIFKLEAEPEFAVTPEESTARRPLTCPTETHPLTVLEAEGGVPSPVPGD